MKTWLDASIEEISFEKTEGGAKEKRPYDDYYTDGEGYTYGVGANS